VVPRKEEYQRDTLKDTSKIIRKDIQKKLSKHIKIFLYIPFTFFNILIL
jgi:hypothetical protein